MAGFDFNAAYDMLEGATQYSARNKVDSYAKANPREADAVEDYFRTGQNKPAPGTRFGRFLVMVGEGLRATSGAPSYGSGTYGGT